MNIIIADDHAITRRGIAASIQDMFPAERIIDCDCADSVLTAITESPVDLAILDLFMPGTDGFLFLKKLTRKHPDIPIAILSATENKTHIQKVIDIGVSGFIHKSSDFDIVKQALETIINGGVFFPDITTSNADREIDFDIPINRDALLNNLTKRQLETLDCLAKGMSNKEIAETLFVSENTVKSHLKAIMNELNCHNRTEAVLLSQQLGLID